MREWVHDPGPCWTSKRHLAHHLGHVNGVCTGGLPRDYRLNAPGNNLHPPDNKKQSPETPKLKEDAWISLPNSVSSRTRPRGPGILQFRRSVHLKSRTARNHIFPSIPYTTALNARCKHQSADFRRCYAMDGNAEKEIPPLSA